MPDESRPASPEQVRLIFGLSSLAMLPLVAIVMVYLIGHQAAADQAPAWRAFAVALVAGACLGAVLVRFVPLFGGSLPGRQSVRTALGIVPVFALIVVIAVGRLAHQGVPVTMGFVAGTDAFLAIVLLTRSLRSLSQMATPPRS
jgi:hypothetical protein